MRAAKVAIVQNYVPQYRVPFFSGLVDTLRNDGVEVGVIAGVPSGTVASRGDAVSEFSWLQIAQPRQLRVRPVDAPFYGSSRLWGDCDGLILPLRGNSLDLCAEIAKKRFSSRRVGCWGHVGTYATDGNRLDLTIERLQMRHADHVFAYTRAGAELAVQSGVEPNRVTPVMNSVDVADIRANSERMDQEHIEAFAQRHQLVPGKTFGYVGALVTAKRIDLLADALEILWARDPEVKILIGGKGDQEDLLSKSIDRGQVVMLGYAGPREKALIDRTSEGMLSPGGIGLLAVECLATKMPVITTDTKRHGPEFEYLSVGETVFVSGENPSDFANLVLDRTYKRYMLRTVDVVDFPSLSNMIDNFASGVRKMLV